MNPQMQAFRCAKYQGLVGGYAEAQTQPTWPQHGNFKASSYASGKESSASRNLAYHKTEVDDGIWMLP